MTSTALSSPARPNGTTPLGRHVTSWSRLAFYFGIALCVQGGIWLLWPHFNTRLPALIAALMLCIGIIATHRGAPLRLIMVGLHLDLQAAMLGFILGHQVFDVYPQWAIWSGATANVITGAVLGIVLALLGTAGLRVTERSRRMGRSQP